MSAARPSRVLIGLGEALAAIEVAWSLRASGFEVMVFHRAGSRPPVRLCRGVSAHAIADPELDTVTAIGDLRNLCAALRPDVVLPLDDAALWLLNQAELAGLPSAGASDSVAEIALDKAMQVELARAAGFSVPETRFLANPDALPPMAFPLVIKAAKAITPEGGGLSKPSGAICADREEFARAADRRWPGGVLVQPYIRGTGEGLFGHVGPSGVVAWSAHRRLRMVNPEGSASSACESIPVDPQLTGPAEELLRRAGWRGLFMIELLRDADGRAWFVELNGRPWGSMALARRRGLEYPAWTVRAALDPCFVPDAAADGPHVVCRHLGMEIAHLAFVLRGPQSKAVESWPSLWRSVLAVLTPGRDRAFYNWKPSEPRVFAADTWRTIAAYGARARGRRR